MALADDPKNDGCNIRFRPHLAANLLFIATTIFPLRLLIPAGTALSVSSMLFWTKQPSAVRYL